MNNREFKNITWIIFIIYFTFLIYMMFFGFNRSINEYTSYNFIPFKTVYLYINNFDKFNFTTWIINLLGNIIVFIPFGILLPLLNKHLGKILRFLMTFVSGILILEILQISLEVGSFDIDDIILNSIGGLIGLAIYRIIRQWGRF